MDRIVQHLKTSRRVLLASHVNPDGDAIGSLIAMGLSLEQLGKQVVLYNESPIPAVYRFLPGVNRITNRAVDLPAHDTAVILDCGNLARIGGIADRVEALKTVINIDHHVTNTRFGDLQAIDPEACATSEIIYRLLAPLGVSVDRAIATSLYTGIFTDTGSFRFSNTNRTAFSICDAMVRHGVDPYEVARHVYGTYSLGRIKLLNLALDSIEIAAGGKLSIMTLSQNMLAETRTQPEDVDGLINYARRIEDVRLAALIQEREANGNGPGKSYHVSLRSDGSIDVAAIAAEFGGGGHASAAGYNVNATLAEIKAEIIRRVTLL